MILYKLKEQQTEKDIERRRVDYLTKEFRTELRERTNKHILYAFTMTTKERHIRNDVGWFDIGARQTFTETLFLKLLHRISSKCCGNYRRNIHKDKRLIPFYSVEHHSKKTGKLVSPHIHATIAVSPEWDDRFQSCLTKNPCRDHYSLNHEMFSGNAIEQWHNKVSSLRLQHLPTSKDKYRWMSYCVKQLDTDYQGVGSFIHSGLREKRVG